MSRVIDQQGYEYRVQYKDPGIDANPSVPEKMKGWQTVITNRGGGRPFHNLGAAKGVLTRERREFDEHRLMVNTHRGRQGEELLPDREWRIQSRPVQDNWTDVDLS